MLILSLLVLKLKEIESQTLRLAYYTQ